MPVAQPADQSESESGPGAVATDRNVRSTDTLISQKSPCSQRVVVRCGKRMLGREPIATASVRILAARPASVTKRRWLWIEPEQ